MWICYAHPAPDIAHCPLLLLLLQADLIMEKKITLTEALCGSAMHIQHLEGRIIRIANPFCKMQMQIKMQCVYCAASVCVGSATCAGSEFSACGVTGVGSVRPALGQVCLLVALFC
mgnify:CR=1 FL=1